MADELRARSALGGGMTGLRSHGDARFVALRELPPAAMLDLRLDPADASALAAAASVLALKLPQTPGKSAASADRVALWFGPDQWLITAPSADVVSLVQALSSVGASAIDVSDLRAEFELAGPHAQDVLRKGCAIDLHPRVFTAGDCALTALARVRVALLQSDNRPAYHLYVERSYAPYLWDWLIDAMFEFGGG
jgi:sarcosine oxidase subunit gamma